MACQRLVAGHLRSDRQITLKQPAWQTFTIASHQAMVIWQLTQKIDAKNVDVDLTRWGLIMIMPDKRTPDDKSDKNGEHRHIYHSKVTKIW